MPAPRDKQYLGRIDLEPEALSALQEIQMALAGVLTLIGPAGPQGMQGIPGPQGIPGAGFPGVFVRKQIPQQVVSSIAFVNDAALFFAMAASEIWVFDMLVIFDAHAMGDIKFSVVGPAGAAGVWGVMPQQVAGGGLQPTGAKNLGESQLAAGDGLGVRQMITIRGLVTNGSTAGDLRLQWAQNSANANPTTVHPLSYVLGTKVN